MDGEKLALRVWPSKHRMQDTAFVHSIFENRICVCKMPKL